MYSADVVARCLERLRTTHDVGTVAEEFAVSERTLRRWLRGETPRATPGRYRSGLPPPTFEALPQKEYAYLLGMYLGDGYISRMPRTWKLRIVLDRKYPEVVAEAARAIVAVRGGPVGAIERPGCIELGKAWCHWPLVFPQHGPGRKHDRPIALAAWQEGITRQQPETLIRGLMHSDGCRHGATIHRHGRVYHYVRYAFSNRSEDIKAILCAHLDLLGIRWSRPNRFHIAIARQSEVAKLDEFVGPKR